MASKELVVFGRISACIGGDARYTSTVRVALDTYAGNVVVTRSETVPVGGMDTLGTGNYSALRYEVTVPCDPKRILRAVRDAFDSTITTYGKPTKRFEWKAPWRSGMFGLSLAKCEKALGDALDAAGM